MTCNHLLFFVAALTSTLLTGCQEYTFSEIPSEKIEAPTNVSPDTDPMNPDEPSTPVTSLPSDPEDLDPDDPNYPVQPEEPSQPSEPIVIEPSEPPPVTEIPMPPPPAPVEPVPPLEPPFETPSEPPVVVVPEPTPPQEELPPEVPGEEELPPHDRLLCNILIDQTGLYFGSTRKYVAITGLTECAYNRFHQIEGPCDDHAQVTILQPSEIDGIYNEDIQDRRRGVTIIPQQEHSHFLCFSIKGRRFVLGAGNKKIIFVGR